VSRLRLPLLPSWLRWLLVAAVLGAIVAGSVVRPTGVRRLVPGPFGLLPSSVWLHGLAYAGLAVVLAYALQTTPRPDWQVLLGVFVVATAVGIGVELLQLTLSYRTFDVTDALVNAAGAALAVTGWKILMRYVRFYRVQRIERATIR
jgi:hypothetical protein